MKLLSLQFLFIAPCLLHVKRKSLISLCPPLKHQNTVIRLLPHASSPQEKRHSSSAVSIFRSMKKHHCLENINDDMYLPP